MTDTRKLFDTRLSLSPDSRAELVDLLNARLADYVNLLSMTLEAHWNVRGSHFHPLHKLFEELYDSLEADLDDLAERITTLGGFAAGGIKRLAAASSLPELPEQPEGDFAYLDLLIDRYAIVARSFSEAVRKAGDIGDENTADLLTGISRSLDKSLWLLEAHRPVR